MPNAWSRAPHPRLKSRYNDGSDSPQHKGPQYSSPSAYLCGHPHERLLDPFPVRLCVHSTEAINGQALCSSKGREQCPVGGLAAAACAGPTPLGGHQWLTRRGRLHQLAGHRWERAYSVVRCLCLCAVWCSRAASGSGGIPMHTLRCHS